MLNFREIKKSGNLMAETENNLYFIGRIGDPDNIAYSIQFSLIKNGVVFDSAQTIENAIRQCEQEENRDARFNQG